jgi:predicted  nucleic acid-binding Zn-ribbon protein
MGEFRGNLENVKDEYEDSKKTAHNLQEIYEDKLDNQENEHETEVSEIKQKHKDDTELLKEELNT